MNAWQLANQLKYLLRAAVWPDGDAEGVFGFIRFTAATDEDTFLDAVTHAPYVIGNVGDAPADRNEPDLYNQTFPFILGVRVEGGQLGEEAILGGARGSSGQGSSAGRGLLEVEEEFLSAVSLLTGADGVNAACSFASAAGAAIVEGLGYVAQRSYRISCLATAERYYHPPIDLVKTANTLTWTLPPDRWDRYQIILRYAAGATPPASPTAGTGITLASDLATTVDHVGTGSYSIWCAYDETYDMETGSAGSAGRYSSAGTEIPGTTIVGV